MFGIGAPELLALIILAIIMFGPEKVPEFSRKAARIYVALRDVANNAQTQLREELGPEYADLELKDLNPKTFVKKHLSNELQMLEDAKKELESAAKEVKTATEDAKAAAEEAQAAVKAAPVVVVPRTPFDPEAT